MKKKQSCLLVLFVLVVVYLSAGLRAGQIVIGPTANSTNPEIISGSNLKDVEIAGSEDWVSWTLTEQVSIPDNTDLWIEVVCDPGQQIGSGNSVSKVELYHSITHTWIGDLEIQVANESRSWQVYSSSSDSSDDINEIVSNDFIFYGDDPNQLWYYRIKDIADEDIGTLDEMVLKVYFKPNTASIAVQEQVVEIDCSGLETILAAQADKSDISALSHDISRSSDMFNKVIAQDVIDEQLSKSGSTKVVITLDNSLIAGDSSIMSKGFSSSAQRQKVKEIREPLISSMKGRKGFKLGRVYDNLLSFSAEVSNSQFIELLQNDEIVSIEPVVELKLFTAQGLPLMGALASRSSYTGSGIAIAICDTGIDYTHPALGGGGFPNSKVIGGYDFGSDDSDPMPVGQAHGTACAGIAAGGINSVGDYIGGVAPGAKLYALKVAEDDSESIPSDDVLAAWDWCITHQYDDPDHPIMVISNSFGGNSFGSECNSYRSALTDAVNQANAAGITVLAASGNEGYCSSIAWPSCISNMISVGAVYDRSYSSITFCVEEDSCISQDDTSYGCSPAFFCRNTNAVSGQVTCYSNSSSILDILAPSTSVYTTDIVGSDGYSSSGDYTSSFGGTSAACPYAAGAVAAIQSKAKSVLGYYFTPDEIRTILVDSGTVVVDVKSGLSKPLVNLANALESIYACEQGSINVSNIGFDDLVISSVTIPQWLNLDPPAPYVLSPGAKQKICLTSDCNIICTGDISEFTDYIIFHSNDPDQPELLVPVEITCARCQEDLTADTNRDCMVNLLDFAEIASQWLDCNLYPVEYCQ